MGVAMEEKEMFPECQNLLVDLTSLGFISTLPEQRKLLGMWVKETSSKELILWFIELRVEWNRNPNQSNQLLEWIML